MDAEVPRPLFLLCIQELFIHFNNLINRLYLYIKMIKSENTINRKPFDYNVIFFIKKNIIFILSVFSFIIIGFDLNTETALENNEIEFCTAILVNSTNPVQPLKIPAIRNEELTELNFRFGSIVVLVNSELKEIFQSRPPPSRSI